jgi:TRAP-type transport system periplasmic protein
LAAAGLSTDCFAAGKDANFLSENAAARAKARRQWEDAMKIGIVIAAAGLALFGSANFAAAQDLPTTQLNVIGLQSHLNSYKTGEVPFWEDRILKESGGKITARLTAQDVHGLKGTEILRLMKLGVIDFSSGVVTYMSGDTPAFEGFDLAGLSPDMATTRKMADAYRPYLGRIMEKEYGAKLLMLFPSPPQVFWCKVAIANASDLKGKKVRVFNKSMSDLVSGLGATSVTMPFGEVTPALERGVLDCAITGTLSGNTNKMHEITTHMYPMYAGWAMHFHAASQRTWDKLDRRVQDFLGKQFEWFNDRLWSVVAEEEQDGINCSIGVDPCKYGYKGKMQLVPVSAADRDAQKKILETVILPDWAKRCGVDCVREWNNSVGRIVGITLGTS